MSDNIWHDPWRRQQSKPAAGTCRPVTAWAAQILIAVLAGRRRQDCGAQDCSAPVLTGLCRPSTHSHHGTQWPLSQGPQGFALVRAGASIPASAHRWLTLSLLQRRGSQD